MRWVGSSQRSPGAGVPLGVLTGLNVLNYLDRYVGAAVLPLIIAELHLTDGQAGSLQSVFILVYALVLARSSAGGATAAAACAWPRWAW